MVICCDLNPGNGEKQTVVLLSGSTVSLNRPKPIQTRVRTAHQIGAGYAEREVATAVAIRGKFGQFSGAHVYCVGGGCQFE